MSSENMRAYFDLSSGVHDEFDFGNDSESIYNMDVTGVPLATHLPKVVAKQGQKKVHCHTYGQKPQISHRLCKCIGSNFPPFIIFAAKQLSHSWIKWSGSRYGVTKAGWTKGYSAIGARTAF